MRLQIRPVCSLFLFILSLAIVTPEARGAVPAAWTGASLRHQSRQTCRP